MLRIFFSFLLTIVILGLIYLFYPVLVVTGKPLLIVNMWNNEELPKHFRMSTDVPKKENQTSLMGLNELKASGSAQFSENGLKAIIKKLPSKQVTIVDLRQESHGFINGIAVSWFMERDWINKGKTLSKVIEDEKQLLLQATSFPLTVVYASKKFPVPLWVRSAYPEEELVKSLGLGYIRVPVTDHLKPSDEVVDQFIQFVNTLPKDSLWLHFHCAAGEGRTTTFLCMYDMMRNASKVKLQDIFLRQHLLGGVNFLNETANDWRKNYIEERKLFLRQFYVYCQENPLFQKTWNEWLAEQRKK